MKPFYTLGMILVLLGLGAYVFFFEQGPKTEPGPDNSHKPQILGFALGDVQKVTLTRGSEQMVLTQPKPDEWEYDGQKADRFKVEGTLNQLKSWQAKETVMENLPAAEAKNFGLAPPQMKVEVVVKSGTKEVLVGSKTPMGTDYYVQLKGDPTLYLSYINVPESVAQLLKEPPKFVPPASASPAASASASP